MQYCAINCDAHGVFVGKWWKIFKKKPYKNVFPLLIRCKLTIPPMGITWILFWFSSCTLNKKTSISRVFFFLQFLFLQGIKYTLILQNSGTYSWNSLHTDGFFWGAVGRESVLCSRAPVWMKRTVPVTRVRVFITLSFYDLWEVRISWSFFFSIQCHACLQYHIHRYKVYHLFDGFT